MNKELKRILTGVSIASLAAGVGLGGFGCAHGS
ncbi:MAG: SbtA family thio(seleno)oxazole RiPP natural product precursor [Deferrisomatales bacterium]